MCAERNVTEKFGIAKQNKDVLFNMAAFLIDSHCHLTNSGLVERLDQVLQNARQAGVSRCIAIGTNPADHQVLRQVCTQFPEVSAVFGIHPEHAHEVSGDYLSPLKDHLKQCPRTVAVGECGLDYFRNTNPPELQKKIFEEHIALARELNLPLVLHIREAHADAQAIMKHHPDIRYVVHCFTGKPDECRIWIDMGAYIGITGIVTYKNAPDVRADALMVPADRLLVETDSPYLSPEPVRKIRMNEPAHTAHTARFVAELRGVSFESLCEQTTANAVRLFGPRIID